MPARHIDVVLMPLLGFDETGNRLGMGGGFYDRAFAFRGQRSVCRRPLLVGLAYHWQEISGLRAQQWDVPMDAIITDREIRRF